MSARSGVYTSSQAARIIGRSINFLFARDEELRATRTAKGYRLYDRDAIRALAVELLGEDAAAARIKAEAEREPPKRGPKPARPARVSFRFKPRVPIALIEAELELGPCAHTSKVDQHAARCSQCLALEPTKRGIRISSPDPTRWVLQPLRSER